MNVEEILSAVEISFLDWWLKCIADEGADSEIVTEATSVVRADPRQDDTSPPKVESEVEILHEKVTKQIIKEGHDQKPSKYSTCFCKSVLKNIST